MTAKENKESSLNKALGERVRALRKARKQTLRELASAMGISFQYLGELERGDRNWSADRIELAAEAFDVSPSLLLDTGVGIERLALISTILQGLSSLSDEQATVIEQLISTMKSNR